MSQDKCSEDDKCFTHHFDNPTEDYISPHASPPKRRRLEVEAPPNETNEDSPKNNNNASLPPVQNESSSSRPVPESSNFIFQFGSTRNVNVDNGSTGKDLIYPQNTSLNINGHSDSFPFTSGLPGLPGLELTNGKYDPTGLPGLPVLELKNDNHDQTGLPDLGVTSHHYYDPTPTTSQFPPIVVTVLPSSSTPQVRRQSDSGSQTDPRRYRKSPNSADEKYDSGPTTNILNMSLGNAPQFTNDRFRSSLHMQLNSGVTPTISYINEKPANPKKSYTLNPTNVTDTINPPQVNPTGTDFTSTGKPNHIANPGLETTQSPNVSTSQTKYSRNLYGNQPSVTMPGSGYISKIFIGEPKSDLQVNEMSRPRSSLNVGPLVPKSDKNKRPSAGVKNLASSRYDDSENKPNLYQPQLASFPSYSTPEDHLTRLQYPGGSTGSYMGLVESEIKVQTENPNYGRNLLLSDSTFGESPYDDATGTRTQEGDKSSTISIVTKNGSVVSVNRNRSRSSPGSASNVGRSGSATDGRRTENSKNNQGESNDPQQNSSNAQSGGDGNDPRKNPPNNGQNGGDGNDPRKNPRKNSKNGKDKNGPKKNSPNKSQDEESENESKTNLPNNSQNEKDGNGFNKNKNLQNNLQNGEYGNGSGFNKNVPNNAQNGKDRSGYNKNLLINTQSGKYGNGSNKNFQNDSQNGEHANDTTKNRPNNSQNGGYGNGSGFNKNLPNNLQNGRDGNGSNKNLQKSSQNGYRNGSGFNKNQPNQSQNGEYGNGSGLNKNQSNQSQNREYGNGSGLNKNQSNQSQNREYGIGSGLNKNQPNQSQNGEYGNGSGLNKNQSQKEEYGNGSGLNKNQSQKEEYGNGSGLNKNQSQNGEYGNGSGLNKNQLNYSQNGENENGSGLNKNQQNQSQNGEYGNGSGLNTNQPNYSQNGENENSHNKNLPFNTLTDDDGNDHTKNVRSNSQNQNNDLEKNKFQYREDDPSRENKIGPYNPEKNANKRETLSHVQFSPAVSGDKYSGSSFGYTGFIYTPQCNPMYMPQFSYTSSTVHPCVDHYLHSRPFSPCITSTVDYRNLNCGSYRIPPLSLQGSSKSNSTAMSAIPKALSSPPKSLSKQSGKTEKYDADGCCYNGVKLIWLFVLAASLMLFHITYLTRCGIDQIPVWPFKTLVNNLRDFSNTRVIEDTYGLLVTFIYIGGFILVCFCYACCKQCGFPSNPKDKCSCKEIKLFLHLTYGIVLVVYLFILQWMRRSPSKVKTLLAAEGMDDCMTLCLFYSLFILVLGVIAFVIYSLERQRIRKFIKKIRNRKVGPASSTSTTKVFPASQPASKQFPVVQSQPQPQRVPTIDKTSAESKQYFINPPLSGPYGGPPEPPGYRYVSCYTRSNCSSQGYGLNRTSRYVNNNLNRNSSCRQ